MRTIILVLQILFLMLNLVPSCKSDKKHLQIEEANDYHQKSEAIRVNLEKTLKAWETSPDSVKPKNVREIERFLVEWDKDFMDVPGFENDHEDDHEHAHHHHRTAPELSSAAHLELQKHLYQSIKTAKRQMQENIDAEN